MRPVSVFVASILLLAWAGRIAALPAGPPMPAATKTTPAQQTIALYREQYAHWHFKPCPPARGSEILICGTGRRGSPDRLPFPEEADVNGPAAALAVAGSCTAANCRGHGTINPIKVATTAVQIVRAIVDPEGASDYADRHPWQPDQ